MAQALLSPELTKQSIALARAMSAAARAWSLYPPEHAAVRAAVSRLADTLRDSMAGAAFAFGVTPDTLLVAGLPLPPEPPVVEAARLLHDRDVLQVTFMGDMPRESVEAFLKLLVTSPDDLRAAGGPAQVWTTYGISSIGVEQIDYEKILEDRETEKPLERRDDVWRSLVNAIVQGKGEFDELQQERLLQIAGSAFDIGELASDVIAPKCNADGSPLITTQAATVLAVFRHLAGIVNVVDPERLPEVMRNVAAASASINPHVVMHMMQIDEGIQEMPIIARIAAGFDDETVAQLLATALAKDGKASARLAQVFDTIAPDDDRKRRVLTMTRSMLSEQDFGKTGQFRAVWSSMEALLLSYDETPYVSSAYQSTLEGAASRGEMLAARDLPPELPEWIETLEQENVRTLSVLLVTDLMRIEENTERAGDIARDMVALVEDLLMAGDFANAALVLRELKTAAKGKIATDAAKSALASAGESAGLREAAGLLGDLDEASLEAFSDCCDLIGPTAIRALHPALQSEAETPAYTRARQIAQRYGAAGATHLTPLAEDSRWFVQRNAAVLLGATRSPEAVPPLQSLLRRSDPRVLRHAVAALASIDDPAAARAVQTALRAATGENRLAVVEALVAERDPRVVPMLGRILSESDPFGDDHDVVLDALNAVRQLADERAVPPVTAVMQRKKFFGGKKARAFKTAAVQALIAIGTPKARAALDTAEKQGDRALKRAVREVRGA